MLILRAILLLAVPVAVGQAGSQSSAKPAAPPKAATAKKTTPPATKKAKPAKRSSTRRPARRPGQVQPTPERYKEIQEALAARGYLSGPPTGVWDAASVEALRRFQEDQHLEPTGKLTSLSLIALGLGPKRNQPGLTRTQPQ